ncbi:MAG: molecular chaperone HtpG [Christensenellaceae bacterium]|nr:molecular chaperone HtpG [Christensenellaceae bacterium]
MAKKQFKAESKRLLDLMINSIYTHKEIFLRELISNASDAIDKLYFRSLTDESVKMDRDDFEIRIEADPAARTLTIKDNGCGMTKQELEENLGTICKSGTLAFKRDNELGEDIEAIGQFGVGFYSAFMVSDRIKVISRAFDAEEAFVWESTGEDGYTIKPTEKTSAGTEIILTLKEDSDDEKYSRFLQEYTLRGLVKKYSDYIRYPIFMMTEKSIPKEGAEDEYETVMEDEVLNSMVPLWRKNKSEVTEEEYNQLYKDKFFDFEDPLAVIHVKAEGTLSYNAILYIPKKPPFDFFSKEYKRGLQLYSSNVMIMDRCEELLPDYFGFVKGIVETADLSLNISREMLQHNRQLKAFSSNLKKKIQSELLKLLKNEREKYEEFFKSFGQTLKYGVYESYGLEKDFLKDLLLYYSDKQKKMISLKEYIAQLETDQDKIYYACGENIERTLKLPQTEFVRDKGFDILCMTDDIDEFAVKILGSYEEKSFQSVSDNDLDVASADEKKEIEEKRESSKDIIAALKNALGEKVKDVRLSMRLRNTPVCLVSDGPLSIEMEKILSSMPIETGAKAERVLEINPDHKVFETLSNLSADDTEKITLYADLLYNQALIIEGLPIEDPVAFSESICRLMV